MGTGDLCRMPLAAVHHGSARKSSGTGPCRNCQRALWLPAPRCQYFGENLFYLKLGIQDEGDRHVTKRSSDPRVGYPEVKVQVRDLVRVVGIVAALPHGMWAGSVPGEKSFYRAPGAKWAQEISARYPQQRCAQGEPDNDQGRYRVGIVEGSSGVSIRGKFVLSKIWDTRRGGGDRHVTKRSSDPRVA